MALTPEEERLLSQLHKNLRQDALEPGEPFWIDFRLDKFNGAVGPDVVRQLARDVAWSEAPAAAFFSGFRGAGKSTELNRLRNDLSDQGFAVVKFDVEEFLDLRFPITAGQLVFAITAGIWRACQHQGWVDASGEGSSPFGRLWDWLRTVRPGGRSELGISLPDWLPVDFELHLRADPTFRQDLGDFLRSRSVELTLKANEFLADLDDQVREHFVAKSRPWLGMVVIVDSLDHARSETAFAEVRNAIREVFDLQLNQVRFDRFRTVFCIPPYIKPAAGTARHIVNVKVADRSGNRWAEGIDALVEVIERRLPPGLARQALIPDADLERLVLCSGGHIRDLLRLVDEVIVGVESLPATPADLDAAIVRLQASFLPLSAEQRRWLARIASTHQLVLDDQDGWEGLAELLDYHMVLSYSNDQPWYDVHPVIADLVAAAGEPG